MAAARQDPQGFIEGLAGPVIIDEFQRVPDLAMAIKGSIDGNRVPGRFLLTQELFAPEFTAHHPNQSISREDLVERLLVGGFPVPVQRGSHRRRQAWFGSYITTILQREVRDMALLEAAFLVRPLPAWSTNLGQRLVKSPKLMLVDSGLLVYLLGADRDRLLADHTLMGHLAENFVAMELRKQLGWLDPHAHLFHFRTMSGREVDVLIERPDGRGVGIEVKAASSVAPQDFRNLRYLRDAVGQRFCRGVLLYLGSEGLTFDAQMFALPISALWRRTN